jgi:hypothetical protein
MSDHSSLVEIDEEFDSPERKPRPGSLEERVAERRMALESRTTDKFDVPGFEGIFKVELQVVGGKRQYAISQRHEHVHDEYQRGLRTAADCVLVATVGFHSIVNDDGDTEPADNCSWKRLAQASDPTLSDMTLAQKGGSRVAILRLLGEENVLNLAGEWKKWMRTRGVEVDRSLEDFS